MNRLKGIARAAGCRGCLHRVHSFLKIMTSSNISRAERTSLPPPMQAGVGVGAAAVFLYLFSALPADPGMWGLLIAALVAVIGGILFHLISPVRRATRRAAKALSVLLFFLVIKGAFVVARHGLL